MSIGARVLGDKMLSLISMEPGRRVLGLAYALARAWQPSSPLFDPIIHHRAFFRTCFCASNCSCSTRPFPSLSLPQAKTSCGTRTACSLMSRQPKAAILDTALSAPLTGGARV